MTALGVASLERLFPDAGEFEPRTRREGLHRWYKVRLRGGIPATRAEEAFRDLPGVERCETAPPAKPAAAFNDTYWKDLWGLSNERYEGIDINCLKVWDKYTVGNPDVIVAVIDGGIQLTHPDLAWNCLKEGHFNYVDNSPDLVSSTHGTHVAGTVAAVGNNGSGIAGIAGGDFVTGRRGVSLLSCQVFKTVTKDGKEVELSGDFERAIKEAADKGAVICQNSWGYTADANGDGKVTDSELNTIQYYFDHIPSAFRAAVDYFIRYAGCDNEGNQLPDSPMKGGLVVFAAGNEAIRYGPPANYEPIVAVGAITRSGERASFSNFGDWVDLCAPGVDIRSTVPLARYAISQGTSMACPHVSGVAALVASYYSGPGFTSEELKVRLLGGANPDIPAREIGPLVDAYGAVVFGGTDPAAPVEDFTAAAPSNYVECTLRAVRAYGYFAIAGATEAAVLAADPFQPSEDVRIGKRIFSDETRIGEEIPVRVEGLDFDTDYYVTVRSFNYGRELTEARKVVRVHTGVNHPPVIGMDSDALSFKQHERVRLPIRLYDPDGHAFRIDFETDGAATIESDADGHFFVLNCPTVRNAPATFQATIKLTDTYGMSAEKRFSYFVEENHAPVLLREPEAVRIYAVGDSFSLDLAPLFSDPDGEALSFTALSLDNAILHASCHDGKAVVTALSRGAGLVSVSATDTMGKQSAFRLRVLVRPDGEGFVLQPGNIVTRSLTVQTGLDSLPTRIRLLTTTGAVLYDATTETSAFEPAVILTDSLAPGRYTLLVEYGGEAWRKTIVKQ